MRKLIENSDLSPEGIADRVQNSTTAQLIEDVADIGLLLDRRSVTCRKGLHKFLRIAALELAVRNGNHQRELEEARTIAAASI